MKLINVIWANEAGRSVYIYEGDHGRRVIEIHGLVDDYETVLATATIEQQNRDVFARDMTVSQPAKAAKCYQCGQLKIFSGEFCDDCEKGNKEEWANVEY